MTKRLFAHIRNRLVQGILLILPLLVTIWLLGLLFKVINVRIAPLVRNLLVWLGIPGLERWFARLGIPIISLLVTVAVVYLLGLVAGNLAGRRLLRLIESWILRIPLVKNIYGSVRQLITAFSFSGTKAFSRVVMLEYPRRGLWTLGFVTTEAEHVIQDSQEDVVAAVPVFLPTTPNPTSGWMILVPTADLLILEMSIEDAIKLIVSGGIVSPVNLGALTRKWPNKNDAAQHP
jgi:uncharacterized membrane protein